MIPSDVPSLSEYDLRLANHLGFIYPPAVGIWAAWIRRSFTWGVFGTVSGLAIGGAYYALCGYNFLAVMVGFPCLLGGCTSVLLGTRHDSWIEGLPQRFLKGLLSGFVLGLMYAVVLNIIGAFMLPSFSPSVDEYSAMIWRAGTVAMTVANSLQTSSCSTGPRGFAPQTPTNQRIHARRRKHPGQWMGHRRRPRDPCRSAVQSGGEFVTDTATCDRCNEAISKADGFLVYSETITGLPGTLARNRQHAALSGLHQRNPDRGQLYKGLPGRTTAAS